MFDKTRVCGLCLVKCDMNEIRRLFDKRCDSQLDLKFFQRLEEKLIGLLKRVSPTPWLVLVMEEIEMMILVVGLELLRGSINLHVRGLGWGSCGRFEHLMNMVRAAIGDVCYEGLGYTESDDGNITIWNDSDFKQPDHMRSHMVHAQLDFISGFGVNVLSKRSWNGWDLDSVKITEKEIKKRIRVIHLKEKKTPVFEQPLFDTETGSYNIREVNKKHVENPDSPLLPATTVKKTFIH